MHWQNKHSWLIPATRSTHTSLQTRQGSSGLQNTPYTVTFWQVLFVRSSSLASPFNQQYICQGLGTKLLRHTHGRNCRSLSMFPSPVFANLRNYRGRKHGNPDTLPSWQGWTAGGHSRTPSGSSRGSTEALLMLIILCQHDLARGPLAAEGSLGAPALWGAGREPRWPLRELSPPGPAVSAQGAPARPRSVPERALARPRGVPWGSSRGVPSGHPRLTPQCSLREPPAPRCPLRPPPPGPAVFPQGAPGPAVSPDGAPARPRTAPWRSSCGVPSDHPRLAPQCSLTELPAPRCSLGEPPAPRYPLTELPPGPAALPEELPRCPLRALPPGRACAELARRHPGPGAAMATVAELKAGRAGAGGVCGRREGGRATCGPPDGSQSCHWR